MHIKHSVVPLQGFTFTKLKATLNKAFCLNLRYLVLFVVGSLMVLHGFTGDVL